MLIRSFQCNIKHLFSIDTLSLTLVSPSLPAAYGIDQDAGRRFKTLREEGGFAALQSSKEVWRGPKASYGAK